MYVCSSLFTCTYYSTNYGASYATVCSHVRV